MNIQEVQKVVAQIKSNLFKNANYFAIGMLKSNFRGSGLQFKEHRVYTHGDDVRFIDWKMLAKTQRPYIRTFEEDRNVEICIIIDASPSMLLGHHQTSKLQAAIEIACLIYLLAKESGDVVKTIVVNGGVSYTSKSSGEKGMGELIALLQRQGLIKNDGTVNRDLIPAESQRELRFKKIMSYIGKKREVVILSDFNDFLSEPELKRVVLRRNVHAFRLLAKIDMTNKLPFSVFAGHGEKGAFSHVHSHGEHLEKILGGKIKDIKITERYLEDFVKEMI